MKLNTSIISREDHQELPDVLLAHKDETMFPHNTFVIAYDFSFIIHDNDDHYYIISYAATRCPY
jgi:hypothetical protein